MTDEERERLCPQGGAMRPGCKASARVIKGGWRPRLGADRSETALGDVSTDIIRNLKPDKGGT
jgi:hypothetical protein